MAFIGGQFGHHSYRISDLIKEWGEASLVVESPPASAGNMGSIPGPGRPNMPQGNWAHTPQILTLCSRAQEPQLATTEPVCHNYRSLHAPEPELRKRGCLDATTKRESPRSRHPAQPKIKGREKES